MNAVLTAVRHEIDGMNWKRKAAWVVVIFLLLQGLFLTGKRFIFGLGAVTNLTDEFPWGMWISFDVVGGVALAAGGFTLCFLVYVIGYHKFHDIVRPTVLTAFLGYVLVAVGLLYDLGKYYNVWHPMIMWNPHSVMFEVAWCVMLYLTVLFLEFVPVVLEKFKLVKPLKTLQKFTIPLVIAGVLLSTLHQSSLGSVFLIVPEKLHPLWYTPILPLLFFLSAVVVGPAMVIVESELSARVFRRGLELNILSELAKYLQVALFVYVGLKIQDFFVRKVVDQVFTMHYESLFMLLELGLLVGAMVILAFPKMRTNSRGLFWAGSLVVIGILLNRFNVSWIGMQRGSGATYMPALSEIGVSLFLVTAGALVFYFVCRFFPIFPAISEEDTERIESLKSRKEKRLSAQVVK
ncbi:MAG: Ni/Fe-hydrogenase cytochrome b subunit [bacterium]|nr:Ni/Fe-hydrogenase cytochrome b subunit [bacterium]